MKILYSPTQYGGIIVRTRSRQLMQVDASDDRQTPAVNNPSGVTTSQTGLSCITGNENTF